MDLKFMIFDNIILDSDNLNDIFPFGILINYELEILHLGNSIKKLLLFNNEDQKLINYIDLVKPPKIIQKEILQNKAKYIIKSKKTGIEFKSQFFEIIKNNTFLIVCTPIIRDIVDINKYNLSINEFAMYDLTPEFLVLLQTQKTSMNELRELNFKLNSHIEELNNAKDNIEKSNKLKSDFIATVSHEIRTPLNGIIGMTSLLLRSHLSLEQRDFVNTIRVSGDSLLTLINDILDFSKIESGKYEIENHPFEIKKCIEESLKLFSYKSLEKDISFFYRIEQNVPIVIEGDSSRLRQILVNLIGNAVKFTERGEIFVSVKLNKQSNENIKIEFCVRDTGIGIPDDKINSLFTPFIQLNSNNNRKYGGTGLGLSITKKLVNIMGGEIWVKSIEGTGSEFYFTIDITNSNINFNDNSFNRSIPEFKNKTLFIISPNNHDFIADKSKRLGWRIKIENNYDLAIDLIKDNKNIDLIIMEYKNIEYLNNISNIRALDLLPIILILNEDCDINILKTKVFKIIKSPIEYRDLFESLLEVLPMLSNRILPEKEMSNSLIKEMGNKNPLNILIAEDNYINQKLISNMFNSMGYLPDIANNGLEVLQAIKIKDYDIIFMDIQMPEMDGIEATEILIKHSKLDLNIVAMTANVMQKDIQKYSEIGIKDYISKPIKIEDLIKYMESYISNKVSENSKPDFNASFLEDTAKSIGESPKVFVLKMTDGIKDEIKKQILNIQDNIQNRDLKKIEFVSHSLKGLCLNFGIEKLGLLFQEIEEKAKQNNITVIEKISKNINNYYLLFEKSFDNYINS